MAAVSQTAICNFGYPSASLGAPYVNCGEKMFALVRHAYCRSSPFAIAGLGFDVFLVGAGGTTKFPVRAPGAGTNFSWLWPAARPPLAFILAVGFACRTLDLRCPGFAIVLLATVLTALAGRIGGGLGAVMRLISAAGFTPAAIAFFAAASERGACFIGPCRSGLTMICRS